MQPDLGITQRIAPIAPARAAAFHILHRVQTTAAHSDDLLHTPAIHALSAEDRNLVTALVLGVLRWQLYLDGVLRPMLQRPDAEQHPAAQLALRLGLFQLLFMDRIPAHAALNESVELARANGAAHAAGMVNALLRRALRERPDPAASKRATLAVALTPAEQAHPDWLLQRWRSHLGHAAARRIAGYDQAEPPATALFEPDPALPQIDDGSRLVAELTAAAKPGARRILDCCAAPGGKTAVLAARHPHAEIVASDNNPKRLDGLRKRMDRNPATAHVKTLLADMTAAPDDPLLRSDFDLILCDAPCSGTGTLARNPEIRHRLRESDFARQAERQRAILLGVADLLAPGGRLVYSTCSLEPEENEDVVGAICAATGLRPVPPHALLSQLSSVQAGAAGLLEQAVQGDSLRTVPGLQPCDGFVAVVLRKV